MCPFSTASGLIIVNVLFVAIFLVFNSRAKVGLNNRFLKTILGLMKKKSPTIASKGFFDI
jgi:hypothetical protein